MIYLDYAANTPADPAVLRCLCETERHYCGNPNARHAAGRAAAARLAEITQSVAGLLGASPEEVIFTSGASEANNLALQGMAHANRDVGRHILTTPLEHGSVSACLEALQRQGWQVEQLRLAADGRVDLQDLAARLRPDTVLVAVSAVDSELGVVQPVQEIARLLRGWPQCRLHVDATQAVGKLPVTFAGADTMSLTAHKFYGPVGVGVLLKRGRAALQPLIYGGASTTPWRSGTPTLALAAGLEAALRQAVEQCAARTAAVQAHNAVLRRQLAARPGVQLNSPPQASPYILNLSVQGVRGPRFQRALDEEDVCVSVRSACAAQGQPSAAVLAVTGDARRALCSWRISLSHLTTEEEIRGFLQAFDACCRRLLPPRTAQNGGNA